MSFTYITHGTGTELDPYLIENAEGLKELLNTSENCGSYYFKQTEDIYLNDISTYDTWKTTAPSYERPNKIVIVYEYDGNNHTIYGLYSSIVNNVGYDAWLFLNKATRIKNLKIKKSLLCLRNSFRIRTVAIFATDCSVFDSCSTDADIYINYTGANNDTAHCAILGNSGSFAALTATDCDYSGKVEFDNCSGNVLFCGLVRHTIYADDSTKYVHINRCSNRGTCVSTNSRVTEFYGIGYTDSYTFTVSDCYNTMDYSNSYDNITVKVRGIGYFGGHYTQMGSLQIQNCYNTGSFSNTSSSTTFNVHGLTSHKCVNCYNFGTISSASAISADNLKCVGGNTSTDCFYRSDIADFQITNTWDTPLTVSQFADSSNFNNWDFQDDWSLENGVRPMLKENPEPQKYTLTLNKNYGNYGTVIGAGSYEAGELVIVSAAPVEGKVFVRWNDGNTSNPRIITMPASNTSFTAGFGHTLTVLSEDESKGTVSGSGNHCPGETATITATPAEGYQFVKWSDDNTTNPRTIFAGGSNSTYTAYFAVAEVAPVTENYTVTLDVNVNGLGTVLGASTYPVNTTVQISATPAAGVTFIKWSDDNTDNPRQITVDQNITLTAIFGYTVSATCEHGEVTGTGVYLPGSDFSLLVTPDTGYRFTEWNDGNTDNPRNFIGLDSAYDLTAVAEYITIHSLDVSANFPAMGTVTGSGSYEDGTSVTVTATPEEGYHFVQWDDGNTDNPRTVVVNTDIIMEAEFALTEVIPEHILTLASNYTVMGSTEGAGEHEEDSNVLISATANDGYVFVRWQDGNRDNPRTIVMPHDDVTYTAYFGYTVTVTSDDISTGTATGSDRYVPGDNAVITAVPAEGYLFDKWDNNSETNPLIITVSDNVTRTASFVIARNISLLSADDSMGIVTLDPNDTSASAGVVKDGATINVYAVPTPDHRFVKWSDDNTDNPRSITVTADTEMTAVFEAVTYYDISATANEANRGVIYGTGTYADTSTATLSAQANQGYRFIAWNDGYTAPTRQVYVDDNYTYTAIFEEVFSREIDLSKYRGKLGRIKSQGSLFTTLTVVKSLMPSNNYCTEIGQFDTQTGKHFIFISVKNPATFSCKQYSLALNHNHTSGDWFTAEPIDESDEQDNTYKLEVKSDGVSAALRLKYLTANNNGENLDYQIILQNLGLEDENWYEGNATYVDDTEVVGVISSIPSGSITGNDHMHLANRGVYTHAEIDDHLDAPNPHSGHELISNKNVADGYAGLNANVKLISSQIPFGNEADTVTEGNDPRLSDARYPTHHAPSHHINGDDPLILMQLTGNLTQARSHDNADTDHDETALHHTLGSTVYQAAPGNHLHDERYAPIAKGVDGGNQHNHDGVNTAAVDHEDLLNIGIYPHSDIDDHIEATNPHSGHEDKANKDIPNGYAGLNARGKLKSEEIDFGTGAGSVCEGNDPRLNDARPPSAHADYHSAGSSDPITISNLAGNLTQARSHNDVDTDTSVSSIHHTIGTGSTQAAAGNHLHDERYAPISMILANNSDLGVNFSVTNSQDGFVLGSETVTITTNTGETDPETGDPITTTETVLKTRMRRLKHSDLAETGTYDHDDIDQFINAASQYEVTVNRGQANGYATLDANGRIPLSQMPSSATSLVPNVADIAARDALTNVADGVQVRVLDASADQSVGSGWALYVYDATNTQWVKLAEQEGLDFTTEWSNIQNKPLSTTVELDTAVTKTHDQNTDTELDHGGTNEISAAAIKAHIDAQNPHSGHESTSNKGIAGGYASLDVNGKVPLTQLPSGIAASSASTADEATHATTADVADYATTAGSATTATSATTAGSAAIADALTSPFTLSLSGHAEGSASIDGSNNVTLNVTIPALAGSTFSLMSEEEVEAIIV